MPTDTTALPRWDLTAIFPKLDSTEFASAFARVKDEIAALAKTFDAESIRRRAEPAVTPEFATLFDSITNRLNALLQNLYTLSSYVGCHTTTDATNDEARKAQSLLSAERAKLDPLLIRYAAWVGTTDIAQLEAASVVARSHAHMLAKAQQQARYQMDEGEERLAAELRPSGITAWARLHGNLSALLTATVELPDGARTLPIAQVRALANDPNREVRRAAFESELKAWESIEIPMAAALNGVKGFQQVVRRNRGYEDDLEPTFLVNGIDRPILSAMQAACVESFPDFHRWLAVKARALGLDRLAWYDLNAPVGAASKQWSWNEAESFIVENFSRFSDRMGDFATRAFRERWVDAEPRLGKEGGAYCTGPLPAISRVMMNFDGSFMSVSTLAHELGHAYHNLNLESRAPLQRETPMTLAETASIFCETLSFEAALARADRDEKIALLNTSLERDLGVVVDIHSRFLFESAVIDLRAARDLTVSEFKERMTEAQRAAYGPDVDPLHPYMWAVKGHYYGPLFYNYPYTFGLLFGIGLFARYQESPDKFRADYDDMLSSTGLADARTLAALFGIDITDIAYWRSALDVVRKRINDFEQLVA
jgi:pepF/M3 family oligoendopeptidase